MHRAFCIFLVSMLVTLMTGCIGPTEGVRTDDPPLELRENLVYMDRSLTLQIPCDVLKAKKLDSGRTEIYARFFNKRNKTAECQIQVKFKDGAGRVMDETGWMPFLLPRREVTEFRHTSLVRNSVNFILLLREAR